VANAANTVVTAIGANSLNVIFGAAAVVALNEQRTIARRIGAKRRNLIPLPPLGILYINKQANSRVNSS
jgi:hypothetical protein